MKSSFQELMGLVSRNLEAKDAESLGELARRLRDLRSVFQADCDLLEVVIRRVEQALRGQG